MATLLGSLLVSLGLETGEFTKGTDKARATANKTAGSISADFTRMQQNIARSAAALSVSLAAVGAGFVISGIKSGVTDGLAYASALGEVAQQLGVSTRALQEYRYVASQVGIEQQQIDDGLGKLTRSLGQAANGARVQTDAFSALGVSIRDQNGHLKTTDQILPELIAAFSRIPEPTRRAALETELFGKAGQKLDTLLAGGVSQVDNLRDAANRLGIVLSDEQISRADETADKLASLQQVMTAQISAQVANNADSILALANAFATLTTNIGGTLVALQDYRNLNAFKNGDIAAGRRLLGSKSGRANLENLYDEQLAANSKARSAGGLSAAEKARLDAEFKKIVARRNYAMELDRRAAKAPAPPPAGTGGGGGGGGGGRPPRAVRAPRGTGARSPSAASGPDLGDQTRSIVAGLFPREAELQELNGSMKTLYAALGKELISLPDFQRASTALQQRIGAVTAEIAKVAQDAAFPDLKLNMNPELFAAGRSFDDLTVGLGKLGQAANDNADAQIEANIRIVESYGQMANNVIGSIGNLVSSLKSGDVLGVLESIINVVTSIVGGLQGIGAFKSKDADFTINNLTPFGGFRAAGGPVVSGRGYIVGEKGPEYFTPSRSGTIIPNDQIGGAGGSRVQIVPSPYFDVIVDGRSAAQAGALMGENNRAAARANSRRLR